MGSVSFTHLLKTLIIITHHTVEPHSVLWYFYIDIHDWYYLSLLPHFISLGTCWFRWPKSQQVVIMGPLPQVWSVELSLTPPLHPIILLCLLASSIFITKQRYIALYYRVTGRWRGYALGQADRDRPLSGSWRVEYVSFPTVRIHVLIL